MSGDSSELVRKVRSLLAAATPGPVTVYPHPRPRQDHDESRFQWGDLVTGGRSMWTMIPMADAEALAFAVNNLGAICDALEAAERRAEEAEAQAAAALECVASSAHKLWTLPPVDRTLATDAVWRDLAYFKPSAAGRALLDRLHAAETERDALRDSLALVTAECARLRSDIDLEREQSAAFVQEIERLRVVEAGAAVLRHLLNNVGRSVEWSRQVRECLHESAGLQYLDQFRSVERDLADSMAKVAELQGDVAALQRDLSSAEKECRMLRAEVERNGGCCSSGAVIVGQAGEEGQ